MQSHDGYSVSALLAFSLDRLITKEPKLLRVEGEQSPCGPAVGWGRSPLEGDRLRGSHLHLRELGQREHARGGGAAGGDGRAGR